jgi:hypothetical protein
VSESGSRGLTSGRARRVDRGERGCWEEMGEDGGERAKGFARVVERFVEAVGVTSRLVRGVDCSW